MAFIYYKKKSQSKKEETMVLKSPDEIAIEALEALFDTNLIQKGMVKEYYIRISDILRRYIEAKFKVVALDKTTWELYQEMRLKRINRAHSDKIRDFLEDCDLVKFAKYVPAQNEIDDIYNKAKEIVKVTTQPKEA